MVTQVRKRGERPAGMLTPREVADVLHVHLNTVRKWSDIGLLQAYRVGPRRDRRFERGEIIRFLRENGRN